jgi:tetratricopeptide (TPR) repeat protein
MILARARQGRVGVAVGLLLSLAAATAFAQAEDAEAAIRQGMDLRKQGQDARALPYLEKAYKLSRTSRTAAQLGLVQMGLGYWVDSEHHLDEALADPDNYWVAKNRPVLEGALTRVRSMIGSLVITGQPTGAEASIRPPPRIQATGRCTTT